MSPWFPAARPCAEMFDTFSGLNVSLAQEGSEFYKLRIISSGLSFAQHKSKVNPRDERFAGTPIETELQGQLRQVPEEAVASIGPHRRGLVECHRGMQ